MLPFSSIRRYQSLLQEGSLTCVEVVEHYLSAIEAGRNLNAFIEVFREEALERASSLDARPRRTGKLHGVVMGIKDNLCFKGHTATAGSAILKGFTSVYSATAVEKLLAEGAIIIGRQNCDEFGMGSTNENSAYGPVLNPADAGYVPGGSSGGSAAAVKAGLCMAALGSDTGGSVRLPADFCGVVGLKPSYGRVSRHGLMAYGSSFDQIGVLAASVEDAALILEVISGPDDFDSTAIQAPVEEIGLGSQQRSYRIAYFEEWISHPSVDPYISATFTDLLARLKDQGHTVESVRFSLTDYIVPTYYVLTTAEASSNLSRYDGIRFGHKTAQPAPNLTHFYRQSRSEGFGKEVKRRIMLGSFVLSAGYFDAYFTKAQQVRRQLKEQTEALFKDFNILLAPTSPTPPYKTGDTQKDPLAMYMGDIFTVFANLTGIPAISLPLFKHPSNLPLGVQVMAESQNEVSLLRFSHQLMQQ